MSIHQTHAKLETRTYSVFANRIDFEFSVSSVDTNELQCILRVTCPVFLPNRLFVSGWSGRGPDLKRFIRQDVSWDASAKVVIPNDDVVHIEHNAASQLKFGNDSWQIDIHSAVLESLEIDNNELKLSRVEGVLEWKMRRHQTSSRCISVECEEASGSREASPVQSLGQPGSSVYRFCESLFYVVHSAFRLFVFCGKPFYLICKFLKWV